MVVLGLLSLGLAFLPFIMLRVHVTGQEGLLVGGSFGVVAGPEGKITLMFNDIYRLLPLCTEIPVFLALSGAKHIPDALAGFCSISPHVTRAALIYPLISAAGLIGAGLFAGRLGGKIARLLIGGVALTIGAIILGNMIGGYVALILLLGTSVAVLITGSGILLKRDAGARGKAIQLIAGSVVIAFMATGIVFLISHWQPTYGDRLGRIDPVTGLIGMGMLLIGGLMSVIATVVRQNAARQTMAGISRWLCIIAVIALPAYAFVRTSGIIREQAHGARRERSLPQPSVSSATLPTVAGARTPPAPGSTHEKRHKKNKSDLMPKPKQIHLPQVEADSVMLTWQLLFVKFLAFIYLYFWLFGNGLASLLYRQPHSASPQSTT